VDLGPQWSPDGRQLAFLSNRDGENQIYLMRLDGGEANRLTEGKRGVQSFEWSPDGKQIAFLAADAHTEAEEKKQKDKDDSRVVDRDDKHARLWLLDVSTGKDRALTSPNLQASEIQWAPSGDRLLISATEHPENDEDTHRIYSVQASDGAMKEIAAPRGPFGRLRASPDGKTIAYVGSRVDGPSPHDLFAHPLDGGPRRNLTGSSLDRPVRHYEWRADGSMILLAQMGFFSHLVSISKDGIGQEIPGLAMNPSTFAVSSSGIIAFAGDTATEPEDLWIWDQKSPPRRVTQLNEPWRKIALAKPELMTYKSFDDLEINAALLRPPGFDGKSKLPLIVLVHGGPTGAWTDTIDIWGQLLAAHGYAVFYPNIRGSTGYGHRFIEMNRGDWGGADFKDVMWGVKHLVSEGIADPNRLGIGGWSYGGYMAEWAITQTDLFKAAVSGAGMANLISEFGTETHPSYDLWMYGWPYEKPTGFLNSSPFVYLKNAKTPMLILQGEADTTDPLGQSQELYRGLKHYGVETELVVYPREPHGFREEKHILDVRTRILEWFDKHLK